MTCTHEGRSQVWIDDYEDDWGDYVNGHWETKYVNYCEDLDLHRWRCTRCGHIGYYSGRARDHFEGRKHDSFIQETNEEYLRGNSR